MSDWERILGEMITLLRVEREPDWANSLEGLASALRADPSAEVASKWLIIFGGMGSFSDLVLHGIDGQPLVHANESLSSLRAKMHRHLLELLQNKS